MPHLPPSPAGCRVWSYWSSKEEEPIQQGFAKDAFSYLMTLRLIPLFPSFLINMVSGLTRVRLGIYVLAT